jgi:hypothetical protein
MTLGACPSIVVFAVWFAGRRRYTLASGGLPASGFSRATP